jgi:murein L,D-transpeptidase YcbB/YkuD
MISHSVPRLLGAGLCALAIAVFAPAAVADPSASETGQPATAASTGASTAPAEQPTAPPPTTGAIPDEKGGSTAAAGAPPANSTGAPTAAVTPNSSEMAPGEGTPAANTPSAAGAERAAPSAPAAAVPVDAAPVDPVTAAVRAKLADKSFPGRDNVAEDISAVIEFYSTRAEPLWTKDGSYTDKAKAIIAELRHADDWGLEPADFSVADLATGAGSDAQGAAEAQLVLSALKYARFARGGRLDPVALSNILDLKPPVKDPKTVLVELADASDPGAYLRGLNPRHPGFEKLRQALLKARGPKQEDEPADPALLVKLPEGKQIKPGVRDDQIALLRQRLKIPAEAADDEQLYDDKLVEAIRGLQRENGLKVNGVLNNRVRAILNKEGEPKRADPKRAIDRLIVNMERWRWLPADLGPFYVMNNIPEFTSEIWKGDELKLKQKIIVGQPSWPTPVLAANMQFVIFHPSWGMPDGIKAKELLPRLRSASNSGTDFFSQLFGGGGNGGSRVLQAYKLQVYYNGRPVDPDSVNWNTADIRQFTFTQPPGADNPLGLVKFRFPNRHDVYMHDTPQRDLFGQSYRALSHGCMRLDEPRRTAEVILNEDKGWSPEKVGELFKGGSEITLDKPVPVYLVYFTARVDDEGHLLTYPDIYGHDDRIMSALRGKPVRYQAPEAIDPTETSARGGGSTISDAGMDSLQDGLPPSKKSKKNNNQAGKSKSSKTVGDTLQDALSNIFLN